MSLGRPLVAALAFALAQALFAAAPARADVETICTLVADASSGAVLVEDGDCDRPAAPASTFKLPIALMGYDAGILAGETTPRWPFKQGYADWRKVWRQPTNPQQWMRESVLWYSQQITLTLGADRFARYVDRFGYGNRDVSGAPGKDGLTQAWLDTSLRITPRQQVSFLTRVVDRKLGLRERAYDMTTRLVDQGAWPGGWRVFGKTGSVGAPNRRGWFVGWAEKDGRRIVFARLSASDGPPGGPLGPITRDALRAELFAAGRI